MSSLEKDLGDRYDLVKEYAPLQMVVLDAMGVIYSSGDDVVDLLIPFAREHGSQLSDVDIASLYRQCSLGRYSSGVLWQLLGLKGDTDELDEFYLQQHTLTPGLRSFLDTLRTWDILSPAFQMMWQNGRGGYGRSMPLRESLLPGLSAGRSASASQIQASTSTVSRCSSSPLKCVSFLMTVSLILRQHAHWVSVPSGFNQVPLPQTFLLTLS